MNRIRFSPVVLGVVLFAHAAMAQEPISGSMKFLFDDAKQNVIASAEKADESIYGYKPAEETRTLAQQLAHVADVNYLLCSSSRSVANPHPGAAPGAQGVLEKTKTRKADIVAAVKASFEFCESAFAEATDASLAEMVELTSPGGATTVPRASVLGLAAYHAGHHYGSIAVYLRSNGMVPPSTERSLESSETSGND